MAIEMVNWLEIPVTDMARARRFYESAFDTKLVDMDINGENYPCFPNKRDDGFSGALVQYDFTKPGNHGPLVYLASDDVAVSVDKIKASGGKVIKEREEIATGFGFFALFEDTEGNLLALQGNK